MLVKKSVVAVVFSLLFTCVNANTLSVSLVDKTGQQIGGAVVWLVPTFELSEEHTPVASEMVQQNKQFLPHILVVQKGADIAFPNRDDIKHHVYSFSSPKAFEFKVYKDNPPAPLTFDQTGEVELGCNIHDWMLGYIKVVDTPFFTRSDSEGQAMLTHLPSGAYALNVWHPRIANEDNGQSMDITVDQDKTTRVTVDAEFLPAIEGFDDYDLDTYH